MSGQLCSYASFKGLDEEQQKVEAHHTVVFGDGDAIKVQNKVRKKRKTSHCQTSLSSFTF